MDENICVNNGERVSNNDEILSQDLSSPHVESFLVEDHGDHTFVKNSIKMLSSDALSENESLNVMRDCEDIGSLNVNVENNPILESFHFENNAAKNPISIANFKEGVSKSFSSCLESFSFESDNGHLVSESSNYERVDNLLSEFQSSLLMKWVKIILIIFL